MEQVGGFTIWADVAKLVAALAALVWAGLAAAFLFLVRREIVTALGRLNDVEVFGVKLAMSGRQSMAAAIELARKGSNPNLVVPQTDRNRALDRAKRERALLECAELLWIDDCPSGCRNETRMLQSFGAMVAFACTTDEALAALRFASTEGQPFHAIISDISRKWPTPDQAAGVTMLSLLKDAAVNLPIVFYVNNLDADRGTPSGAFGLCNRPDELLNLVIDALARTRSHG